VVQQEEDLTQRLFDSQDHCQERVEPFSSKSAADDLKERPEAVRDFRLQAGFNLRTSEVEV
jgi:hypothetical protein